MANKNPIYEEYNDKVMDLFYRTKLREGEKVIDNRDSFIAKELGIHTQEVCRIISRNLDDKFAELNVKYELINP